MPLDTAPVTQVEDVKRGELEVKGVSKWFRSRRGIVQALDNISLRVAPGGFVCLVGPSGCGKSTLLDIIAGLTRPDRGRVTATVCPSPARSASASSCSRNPRCFPGSTRWAT